jgi:hypothetical protein
MGATKKVARIDNRSIRFVSGQLEEVRVRNTPIYL